MEVFNRVLGDNKNQLFVTREDDVPTAEEQLAGTVRGRAYGRGHVCQHPRRGPVHRSAWISGNGCVPIYGLMEDAATAEISRTSIWQWIHHQKTLSNGKPVTKTPVPPDAGRRDAGDPGRKASTASAADVLTTPRA